MAASIGATHAPTPLGDTLANIFPWLMAGYFAAQVARRLTESSALGLDEAEQLVMAQAFAWGYGSQPPLYSWIQALAFQVFGRSVLALALLKNVVLFLTFLAFFKASERILADRRKAVAATLTLFLIPQIGWESQRALVHTPAAVCAAAATVFCFVDLLGLRRTLAFALFGTVIAAGILSKYSFVLFISAMLLAAATTAPGRRVLFDSRMFLVALPVTLGLTGPTLLWSYRNADLVLSRTWKFQDASDLSGPAAWGAGLFQLGSATVAFSILCVAAYVLAALPFRRLVPRQAPGAAMPGVSDHVSEALRRIIILTPAVALALLAAFVVATGATNFKDRWLQPYLFLLPLVCFIVLDPFLGRSRQIILAGIGAALALVVFAALVIYHQSARIRNRPPHATAPFVTIVDKVRGLGFTSGTIIGPDSYIVGNLMFRIPDARGITAEYSRLPVTYAAPILLAWQGDMSVTERSGMERAFRVVCGRPLPMPLAPVVLRAPYKAAPDKSFEIEVVRWPTCPN